MDLSSINVGAWWPLLLVIASMLLFVSVWIRRKGVRFPDIAAVRRPIMSGGVLDKLPLWLGMVIGLLLVFAMMDISTSRQISAETRARDFLVVVDTSRSMREDTPLLRADFPPTYERRAGLYVGQSDDPASIPNLARYEIARESLLHYLSTRREEDRVGLVYFNSLVYVLSGFTSNFDFLEQQLAGMDPYVTYGTNIRWALEQGLDMIERYPGSNKRAVILLTDAEARNTADLQEQFDRMRRLDVTFYLLWITDPAHSRSSLAAEFLKSARRLGSVYTVTDVGEGFLDEALEEIGNLEDYAYSEVRFERVDLSWYCLQVAKVLMLVWVLLVGTAYLPLKNLVYAGKQHV